jgi:hypothetical protein
LIPSILKVMTLSEVDTLIYIHFMADFLLSGNQPSPGPGVFLEEADEYVASTFYALLADYKQVLL